MQRAILAFFLGVISGLYLPDLLAWPWIVILLGVGFLLCRYGRFSIPFYFILGLTYLTIQAHFLLSSELPPAWQSQDVVLRGHITDLPQQTELGWQFDFLPYQAHKQQQPFTAPQRVRLTWYGKNLPDLRPGQHWQLTVRLKRPRGLSNPAGWDYSASLLQQRIRATGYVRAAEAQPSTDVRFSIDKIRDHLKRVLWHSLGENDTASLFVALLLGERQFITATQWNTLQHTGTAHLMAISGLHISLVVFFVFYVVRYLWTLYPRLPLWIPAPKVAALLALLAAFFYALLAGWSIPTQRAFLMTGLLTLGYLFLRRWQGSQIFFVALLGVLLYDPFAPLSLGFWLSFSAVALLIYIHSGRIYTQKSMTWRGKIWLFSRSQMALMLGLAPLSLSFFGFISLSSFIANAIAIPTMMFYIPIVLFSGLITLIWSEVGLFLGAYSLYLLDALWWLLTQLESLTWSHWQGIRPSPWALGAAVVGVVVLLLPRAIGLRLVGILWLVPLFFVPHPDTPAFGHYWLSVLDVGQGLAVVVQTQHHVLVYDAGPQLRSGFNVGEQVVIPFLQQQRQQKVDRLVISHDDSDHSGGAIPLIRALRVAEVYHSGRVRYGDMPHHLCIRGDRWQWDGVHFEFLHPPAHGGGKDKNERSCVLKIHHAHGSTLLTGDIPARTEAILLRRAELKAALKADILIAPHHGSHNSSTLPFIRAVSPQWVLFSSGYLNQFHFPREEVITRYQSLPSVKLLNTAEQGALLLRINADGIHSQYTREQQRRFWHD
ncbi:DNA internalization-related competence protein ComEC/Rec2 [Thioflexithrix psekupsensis]|nr:DNA internalization-related competence protein ComEC/Rec2 [Thioflexithrix psekupsensis]